jgi:hypothetical protein
VTLDPAQLGKALPKCGKPRLPFRIGLGIASEHPNAPHPLALLRSGRERPCRGAAEERDEVAPFHYSITWSARA